MARSRWTTTLLACVGLKAVPLVGCSEPVPAPVAVALGGQPVAASGLTHGPPPHAATPRIPPCSSNG